jgi:26S proteasome regulatory subunit N11
MKLEQMDKIQEANIDTMKSMAGLAEKYTKWVEDQMEKSKEEMLVDNVGKINPVKHINQVRFFYFLTRQNAESLMSKNIVQSLGTMLNTKAF